ncbi:HK97 gp10 family phage protein [Thermoactinomyces daqus]|uniref:HK97 gp10 family phage protein n=1 Tax=Thermoactinomyces daqus TaxID=1329516 RepID=A0A7W1X8G4_9BACL|nr:HK97 gp10 family phage protein [Thermoactinomyces daqus]MBA4541976.1 HK97 gp10 family phage protein [Thermoactinomyces daqus]
MGISVKVRVDDAAFKAGADKLNRAVMQSVKNVLAYGVAQAKKNAPVKTGHLRRSIFNLSPVRPTGTRYGSAVVYARIQELGGTIKPKNKKYLRFVVDDKVVYARKVNIKGKHYLKRSADETQKRVPDLVRAAIRSVT